MGLQSLRLLRRHLPLHKGGYSPPYSKAAETGGTPHPALRATFCSAADGRPLCLLRRHLP